MRFVFKTDYDQDIRLLKHSGYWWSYGALLAVLIAFPYLVGSYLQSQIVFVFIYAIVGVALIILTGFTGQASLGHAAFLAIGAYTAGFLQSQGRVDGQSGAVWYLGEAVQRRVSLDIGLRSGALGVALADARLPLSRSGGARSRTATATSPNAVTSSPSAAVRPRGRTRSSSSPAASRNGPTIAAPTRSRPTRPRRGTRSRWSSVTDSASPSGSARR